MKSLSLLLALILLGSLVTEPAQAEITSIATAINKAGRQRMLSQRMLKAYCMIGINVGDEEARLQLDNAIALFDSQLKELTAYAPNLPIKQALSRVNEHWLPYKSMLQQPVQRINARQLLEASDSVLRTSHKVVLLLEDLSSNQYGRMVNIAGRQRMLTQRLAKLYMLRSWQFGGAEIRSEIEQSKNEFKGALSELMSAPQNTQRLNNELAMAKKEWSLLEHSLERNGDKLVPLIVAVTSETLLRRMNEVTHLYEQLSVNAR